MKAVLLTKPWSQDSLSRLKELRYKQPAKQRACVDSADWYSVNCNFQYVSFHDWWDYILSRNKISNPLRSKAANKRQLACTIAQTR